MKKANASHIAVIYGTDPQEMVPRLMDHFDVASEVPKGATIGIKPNLVIAKPSSSGATTDPEIVGSVIFYLKSKGFKDIVILESSWVGDNTDRVFKVCGYKALSRQRGVPLVNLERDGSSMHRVEGVDINVCNRVFEIDYLINIPVLKAHCQTRLTCALKNLKGLVPDSEKKRFHNIGLAKPIAALSKIVSTSFVIVDGIIGDLTFEEGGTPVHMNRLIAGRDPVLIDSYAATLLGFNSHDIEYIPLAEALGVGTSRLNEASIVTLNQPTSKRIAISDNREIRSLLRYVRQDRACSACLSGLIHALKRVEEAGLLNRLDSAVNIGQGFKERAGSGIGIGSCTSGFTRSLSGCPPNARDIKNFLQKCFK